MGCQTYAGHEDGAVVFFRLIIASGMPTARVQRGSAKVFAYAVAFTDKPGNMNDTIMKKTQDLATHLPLSLVAKWNEINEQIFAEDVVVYKKELIHSTL